VENAPIPTAESSVAMEENKMKRPKHSNCRTNMDYLLKVEEYCDYLEKLIDTPTSYDEGFNDGILIYNQLERDEYEQYLNLSEEKRLKVDNAILRISKEVFNVCQNSR
jgi:hypothetical protein